MSDEACRHVIEYIDPWPEGPVSRCTKCGKGWGKWKLIDGHLESDAGDGSKVIVHGA